MTGGPRLQRSVPGADEPVGELDGLPQPAEGFSGAQLVGGGLGMFVAGIGWAAFVHYTPAWASWAALGAAVGSVALIVLARCLSRGGR